MIDWELETCYRTPTWSARVGKCSFKVVQYKNCAKAGVGGTYAAATHTVPTIDDAKAWCVEQIPAQIERYQKEADRALDTIAKLKAVMEEGK